MAEVKVLIEGYTSAEAVGASGEEKTCPTITLVKDKGVVMVVDPMRRNDEVSPHHRH